MSWPHVMGGVLVAFLVIYSLTGGADYGGGVWDLLARGPRAQDQRNLIKRAIGPIWEANHVWLIAMIVVLFANFPLAFATLSTALHLPLTLLLFGIILRGSAFVFRAYDEEAAQGLWSRVFSIASTVTPVMLGVSLGALSVGKIRVDGEGNYIAGFVDVWLQPFPFAVGFFTLALFAYLAAVYLAEFTTDPNLKEDFRLRALVSGIVAGVLGPIILLIANANATYIVERLTRSSWALPLHLSAAIAAVGTLFCLYRRSFKLARFLAAAQVTLIILGWAFAHFPYLIWPDVTITTGIAPDEVLRLTFWVLVGGSLLLLPSFIYLFKIFGREASQGRETNT